MNDKIFGKYIRNIDEKFHTKTLNYNLDDIFCRVKYNKIYSGETKYKVSIVVRYYNSSLENCFKCVKSLLSQTLVEKEIVFVDDGSDDKNLEYINFNFFGNIKVVSSPINGGRAYARNVGIKHSTGEYIYFLDIDDVMYDDNALENIYNFSKKNDLNICLAQFVGIDKQILPRWVPLFEDLKNNLGNIKQLAINANTTILPVNASLYKNKDLLFVDEDIPSAEDCNFLCQNTMNTSEDKIGYYEFPTYIYNNKSLNSFNYKYIKYNPVVKDGFQKKDINLFNIINKKNIDVSINIDDFFEDNILINLLSLKKYCKKYNININFVSDNQNIIDYNKKIKIEYGIDFDFCISKQKNESNLYTDISKYYNITNILYQYHKYISYDVDDKIVIYDHIKKFDSDVKYFDMKYDINIFDIFSAKTIDFICNNECEEIIYPIILKKDFKCTLESIPKDILDEKIIDQFPMSEYSYDKQLLKNLVISKKSINVFSRNFVKKILNNDQA